MEQGFCGIGSDVSNWRIFSSGNFDERHDDFHSVPVSFSNVVATLEFEVSVVEERLLQGVAGVQYG
jgi:hypothetical protein